MKKKYSNSFGNAVETTHHSDNGIYILNSQDIMMMFEQGKKKKRKIHKEKK